MAPTIVVVGGGVIGASVAFHLAERGVGDIVLIERDRLGAGSSWHSAGNITWKPIADNDEPVLYMRETIGRLERATGQETGWRDTGRLFLARNERALGELEAQARAAQERGFASVMLTPEEAAARHPLLAAEPLAGAWLNGLSGRLNPADLIQAYARAARGLDARIVEGTPVRGIATTGGRVRGIETDDGTMAADAVVVCAGLWSRWLLAPLGIPLALLPCEHFYVIAQVTPRLVRETPSFICPEDLIYGREEVGGLLYGCFDEDATTLEAGDLPEPFTFALLPANWDKFAPYFENAARLFPPVRDAPVRSFVNGPEAFTPDGDPLVGPLAGIDGLYVAAGMNSHGVTISAGVGHIVADLIEGREPRFDQARYDPARFGARAADPDWLRREVAGAPSRYYLQSNM